MKYYMHFILSIIVLSFMHFKNSYSLEAIKNDLKLVHYTSPKAMLNYFSQSFDLHPILLESKNKKDINKACLIIDTHKALNAQARLKGIKLFLENPENQKAILDLQKKNSKSNLTQPDASWENLKDGSTVALTIALGLGALYYIKNNNLKPRIECIIPLCLAATYFKEEDDDSDTDDNEVLSVQPIVNQNPQEIIEVLEKAQQAVSARLKKLIKLKSKENSLTNLSDND